MYVNMCVCVITAILGFTINLMRALALNPRGSVSSAIKTVSKSDENDFKKLSIN